MGSAALDAGGRACLVSLAEGLIDHQEVRTHGGEAVTHSSHHREYIVHFLPTGRGNNCIGAGGTV